MLDFQDIGWLADRGYAGFNKVNLHNWRASQRQRHPRPPEDATEGV